MIEIALEINGEISMAKIDEYRNKVNEQTNSSQTGQSSSNGTDTYQLARDQEYSALLDKEVQLENAKQNAMKYTNAQIASNGFSGTGYGSTQQSAIYGQYMNALGNAQNTAQSNISNINLQEAQANEEAANDRFQSLTTMISTATSKEQMDSLLEDYGYMKDGEWLAEKPDSISDDDWYQMKYYYNLQKDQIGDDDFNGTYYSNVDNLKSSGTYLNNGKVESINGHFDNEMTLLSNKLSSGSVPYGTAIAMLNSHNKTIFVMYTKNGLRMMDYDDFSKLDSSKQKYIFGSTDGSVKWTTSEEGQKLFETMGKLPGSNM